jgi:hypothetical protein
LNYHWQTHFTCRTSSYEYPAGRNGGARSILLTPIATVKQEQVPSAPPQDAQEIGLGFAVLMEP